MINKTGILHVGIRQATTRPLVILLCIDTQLLYDEYEAVLYGCRSQ